MTVKKRCARCGEPVDDEWRVTPEDTEVYHGTCLLNKICSAPAPRRAER